MLTALAIVYRCITDVGEAFAGKVYGKQGAEGKKMNVAKRTSQIYSLLHKFLKKQFWKISFQFSEINTNEAYMLRKLLLC